MYHKNKQYDCSCELAMSSITKIINWPGQPIDNSSNGNIVDLSEVEYCFSIYLKIIVW